MRAKIKLKECRADGCSNLFRPFKTTDRFCSPACAYGNTKPINKVSDKKKKEDILYTLGRREFLSLPENKYCPVVKEVFNLNILTNQIHHKAGRVGWLYLYKPYWLAVSQMGHDWVHANPKKACKLGFSIKSTTV